MPGLQYLGDIEKDTAGGYLARVLGGSIGKGLETYTAMTEKQREEKSKLDLLSYDRKMEAVNLISTSIPKMVSGGVMSEEQAREFLTDPEVEALFDSVNVPLPSFGDKDDLNILGEVSGAVKRGIRKIFPEGTSVSPTVRGAEADVAQIKKGRASSIRGKMKRFPKGTTEEEILHTMKTHNITRRQLLDRIGE